MTFTDSQIRSLIAHLREHKAPATHDIGHKLPDVLEYLLSQRAKTLADVVDKYVKAA